MLAPLTPVTVALVDDDRMLLQSLLAWLNTTTAVRPVAAVATVSELLNTGCERPDVTLLDLQLRDGSAPADNIRRLREYGTRVLIISNVPDHRRIVAAVADGADGYVTKDNDLTVLVDAVGEVAAGRTGHSPELAFAWAHDDTWPVALSRQERAVLLAYASGLTLKAAARRAGITPHTAKDYLDRVKEKYRRAGRPAYTKIDLRNRVEEDGYLAPGWQG